MKFSFKKTWAMATKDFKTYFHTPIGYILIAGFMAIMGWLFFLNISHYNQLVIQYRQFGGRNAGISEGIIRPLYRYMNMIFLFLVPFITMRLFSEERKMQTIQLLMTSPISIGEMIIGKFLSAVILVGTMLLMAAIYPVILAIYGDPDLGTIFTCNLGTFLLSCIYISWGIFFSSLTENQIIAGALTFAFGIYFWIIGWAAQSTKTIFSSTLDYLSLAQRYSNFSQGILNTSDMLFYLSCIIFGLVCTYRVLDSYRWRT